MNYTELRLKCTLGTRGYLRGTIDQLVDNVVFAHRISPIEFLYRVEETQGNPFRTIEYLLPFFQWLDLPADTEEYIPALANLVLNEVSQEPEKVLPGSSRNVEEIRQMKEFTDQLFQIKRPNPLAPALEDFVEIKWNPERGRHVVINKDVPIGTTLMVEKPFVATLEDTMEKGGKFVSHCHHCFKRTLKPEAVSCMGCSFAYFCSETCKERANSSYHKYECGCLSDFHKIFKNSLNIAGPDGEALTSTVFRGSQNMYISLKLVCTWIPRELVKAFDLDPTSDDPTFTGQGQDSSSSSSFLIQEYYKPGAALLDGVILGCDPRSKVYDPQSYLPIYHLQPGKQNSESWKLVPKAVSALVITCLLDRNTDFFTDGVEVHQKPKLFATVASLLLRHIENIEVNIFSLREIKSSYIPKSEVKNHHEEDQDDDEEEDEEDPSEIVARGVFATASLYNHSCDPNVARFFDLNRSGEMVTVALKSLKKGEELCLSYSSLFHMSHWTTRQRVLSSCYDFQCTCLACIEYWPVDYESLAPTLCCPGCSSKLSSGSRTRERMIEITLKQKRNVQCSRCKMKHDGIKLKKEVEKRAKRYKECCRLVHTAFPLAAYKDLVSIMEFYGTHLVPPGEVSDVEEIFKDVILFIIHYSHF